MSEQATGAAPGLPQSGRTFPPTARQMAEMAAFSCTYGYDLPIWMAIEWLRCENELPGLIFLRPALDKCPPWNIKESLLRQLTRASDADLEPYRGELSDLIIGAVRRRQELYDRYYSRLALRCDSPDLRARLTRCLDAPGATTAIRAAWLLDVLADPGRPPTRARWRQWSAAHHLPHRLDPARHVPDARDEVHARRRAAREELRREWEALLAARARRPGAEAEAEAEAEK